MYDRRLPGEDGDQKSKPHKSLLRDAPTGSDMTQPKVHWAHHARAIWKPVIQKQIKYAF